MHASVHHGQLPLILSGPRPSQGPAGGLDSLSYEILTRRGPWKIDAEELGFQINNPAPGYPAMWVIAMDPEDDNDLVARVQINCIGLLADTQKRRRRMSVAGREIAVGPNAQYVLAWSTEEQGSELDGDPIDRVKRRVPALDGVGEPIYKNITTPLGVAYRWNVREAIVVLTDTYFVTARPAMDTAGRNIVPPNAPTPPPYIWGDYPEPMRFNFPSGWVLDDRQVEEHFRLSDVQGLWEVTDTMGYYYAAAPD